ncbi:YqiA/YcfP family alpha/beta fold hydrolase [Ketobacter sp.]
MPDPYHLFYIHGFNSSPQSAKAQQTRHALVRFPHVQFHVPQLPFDPIRAMAILEQEIQQCLPQKIGLIGSSMGGYLGTYVAEKYKLPLAMINPAVRPYELLQDYLGEMTNDHTGEKYVFTQDHMQVIKGFEVTQITRPERYLLLTQTGDETLDYRQGVEKYAACKQIVEQGGDHSFQNFDQHLTRIFEFLGVA